MLKDAALLALQDIVDRLRVATNASRTTIRLDCRALSQKLETVAAESLDDGARSLKKEWTANARQSAAVRWLVQNRRTFVMEDCLNPWAPEVAPEDYVIERYGIRSEMLRGVFSGDELIGVVSVHCTPGPRSWDDAELGMIERACDEVLAIVEQFEAGVPGSERHSQEDQLNKRYFNPPSLPSPRNYHHAVSVQGGRTIYLAGQVAFDRDRNIIGDDVVTQARHALRNMATAVEAAGGTLADVVQITLHIVNYSPDQLNPIAGTLREFFPPDRLPANTLVAVSSLSVEGLLIEITGIAVTDSAS